MNEEGASVSVQALPAPESGSKDNVMHMHTLEPPSALASDPHAPPGLSAKEPGERRRRVGDSRICAGVRKVLGGVEVWKRATLL